MSSEANHNKIAKKRIAKNPQSEYLLPIEQVFRPLHPGERAKEAAQRAFEKIHQDYPSLVATSDRQENSSEGQPNSANPTYRLILDVAHTYWFEHRVYERQPEEALNIEIEKIGRATAQLSDVLASAPPAALGLLTPALQRQFSATSVWPGLSEKSISLSEGKKVTLLLKALEIACERSHLSKDTRGAREKRHIIRAAKALVSFWRDQGRPFKKNIQIAQGKDKTYEFLGEGPLFVWRILSAIDPALTIGEARTALKKLGGRKSLSRNSPPRRSNS